MITTIDVGATKTLVAQFDHNGEPQNKTRFLTPKLVDDFLVALSKALKEFSEITSISIAIPGRFDRNGETILACGNLDWCNIPLKKMLVEAYNCPVFMENDANLAALSEINLLPEVPQLGLYITVSTGIGSGIIAKGQLLPALRNSEAGQIPIRTTDGWQKWEDLASGRAIKEHFGKLAQDLHTPEELNWISERLSLGLVSLIPALEPDVIVFGGGVGNYFERFDDLLTEHVRSKITPYIDMPQFKKAVHPEEAVLYGCYLYATRHPAS